MAHIPPPYAYDDPRIAYDEACFFYNGGFDEVCLAERTSSRRLGGGRAVASYKAPYKDKTKPTKEPLDIRMRSRLKSVNDTVYDQVVKNHWVRNADPLEVTGDVWNSDNAEKVVKANLLLFKPSSKVIQSEFVTHQTVTGSVTINGIKITNPKIEINVVRPIKPDRSN